MQIEEDTPYLHVEELSTYRPEPSQLADWQNGFDFVTTSHAG